ncbi:hypothetical protein SO694_00032392 [Aureococcus anophagefferens]|uniref:SH3 domain-containing protein n=1 Tax=Aureococcus anophagefferens TaxID=44056 RepID=A0ABR1FKH5_AURAN
MDGWILVSRLDESGYVPTAYIRPASPSVASSSGAAPAPPAAAAPPVAPPPRRNPNVDDVDDSDDDDDDEGTVGPRLEKRARARPRGRSDKFQVTFDATASATDKANAVAAGLLIDYMFFEIDHGLCGPETSVGAPTAPDARPRAAPRAQLLPAMRAHKMEHRD